MKEYNYKNWSDQPSHQSILHGWKNITGSSCNTDEVAEKVMYKKIDYSLKKEAREVREAVRDEVIKQTTKIEKNILEFLDNSIKSVDEPQNSESQLNSEPLAYSVLGKVRDILGVDEAAEKAAKDAAEKAVKNVGPEVANLLEPKMKIQIEEEVKKYTEEKIESLIKPEITSKIDDFLAEQKEEVSKFLKDEMDKLIEDAHKNLNGKIDQITCELLETKSELLKTAAGSFHQSAQLFSLMAEDTTCENQDLVYF